MIRHLLSYLQSSLRTALRRSPRLSLLLAILSVATTVAHAGPTWQQPTEEELHMTAQPQVPGAPAVILDHEETTDDRIHSWTFYTRIKILNEAGRLAYSDVAVKYPAAVLHLFDYAEADEYTISEIAGRTIHPDGTVIPFTGKPHDRILQKDTEAALKEKIFALPDVQVGSILEYRYTMRYPDDVVYVPSWFVQSDLFTRRAHYVWHTQYSTVAFTSTLPDGAAAVTRTPEQSSTRLYATYSIDRQNILPEPSDSYLPPLHSLVQRVIFYIFGPTDHIATPAAFWDSKGKDWSREINRFLGSSNAIAQQTASLTATVTNPDERLRALYASIQQMENTRFTREHTQREDKAQGLSKTRHAEDILAHRRGTPDQLTRLFVAMARAAGLKAYIMAVTNRDRNVFVPAWLSLDQLDDEIAIVEIEGKDRFFDPGQRDCPYGQLQWMHTAASGLRQTEKGTQIADTPMGASKDSHIQRVADLTVDPTGQATGKISLSWTGAPALDWRQTARRTDPAELGKQLQTHLRAMLPAGAEITLLGIDHLEDDDQPLVARFQFDSPLFTVTARRAILPAELFQTNDKALFPRETRDYPVYFSYPALTADIIRIVFPPTWTIDQTPANTALKFSDMAAYNLSAQRYRNAVMLRREYLLGSVVAFAREYPELRTFYNNLATADQQPLLFTIGAPKP